MVGRLLLWAILGFLAWWILRPRKAAPPNGAAQARGSAGGAPEAMVDCAHCGLHFPGSEAIRDGARRYCCTAHRDAGPRHGQ